MQGRYRVGDAVIYLPDKAVYKVMSEPFFFKGGVHYYIMGGVTKGKAMSKIHTASEQSLQKTSIKGGFSA